MDTSAASTSLLERARQSLRVNGENSGHGWIREGVYTWHGFDKREYIKKAVLDGAIAVECWKPVKEEMSYDLTFSDKEVRYIKEDEIPAMLQHASSSDREFSAGLKLVHKFDTSQSTKDAFLSPPFAAFNDRLGLSDSFSNPGTSFTGAYAKFMSTNSRAVTFGCKLGTPCCNHTTSTVVQHDFEAATTVGYLVSNKQARVHSTLLRLPGQFRSLSHPLLVPVFMGEQMLTEFSFDLSKVGKMIGKIEEGTGFKYHVADESNHGHSDGLANFRELFRDLGRVASMFADLKSRILALKDLFEFLSRELRAYKSWVPKDKWKVYANPTRKLIERVDYMRSHIGHCLISQGIEMRLQVFNLIAQEDNRNNIQLSDEMRQIAIKTKRDGSVMKAIAFLGTLFLPATFVSTFFAMPLFDWGASTTSEIVTNHFWIYWAVTVPLTAVTMIVVGYWILSRAQKELDRKDSSFDKPQPSNIDRLNEKLIFGERRLLKTQSSVQGLKVLSSHSKVSWFLLSGSSSGSHWTGRRKLVWRS